MTMGIRLFVVRCFVLVVTYLLAEKPSDSSVTQLILVALGAIVILVLVNLESKTILGLFEHLEFFVKT